MCILSYNPLLPSSSKPLTLAYDAKQVINEATFSLLALGESELSINSASLFTFTHCHTLYITLYLPISLKMSTKLNVCVAFVFTYLNLFSVLLNLLLFPHNFISFQVSIIHLRCHFNLTVNITMYFIPEEIVVYYP